MGIKSFQGKQVGEANVQAEKITVRDCMSQSMILFHKDQSIIEVVDMLIKFRVSGGPVVDEQKRVIGIISEGDCVKQISESRYYNMPMEDTRVERYMSREVETISPDVNLFDVANLFLKSKRRRFPVVEEDRIIGIVSQKDVLRTALMLKSFSWKHK